MVLIANWMSPIPFVTFILAKTGEIIQFANFLKSSRILKKWPLKVAAHLEKWPQIDKGRLKKVRDTENKPNFKLHDIIYIGTEPWGGGWTLQFSVVWEDLSQSNEWVREAKSSILKMPRFANPARITEHVCVRTEMTCHTQHVTP